MADQRHQHIMAIFDEVCDLPKHEQERSLQDLCGDDDDLRREVQSMLDHDGTREELFREIERGRGIEVVAGDILSDFDQTSFTGEIGRRASPHGAPRSGRSLR